MLNILLMIILIIILFIIILLYIGIRISLIYEKKGNNINGCVKILVLKKIKVISYTFPKKEESNDKKETDFKKLFKLIKPCLGDLKIYLKKILNSLHITRLENHLLFGLDSYADTAKYIGIIWGVLSIANNLHENAYLTAEASFNGSVVDMKGNNEVEINLLKIIIPTIQLISKKNIRVLIRGVLDERN